MLLFIYAIFIREDSRKKKSNESTAFSYRNLVGDDTKAVPELDIKASLALFVEASAIQGWYKPLNH